jgi:hypothetical protein
MKSMCVKALILAAAFAVTPFGFNSRPALVFAAQTAPAANPAPQSNPPAKAKKRPDEPIDPDATAGVRGTGTAHTVRVLFKSKPAAGAHVVVKNTDGTLAASCYTGDAGECQVNVGADRYTIGATTKGRAGIVSMSVEDSTGPIVVKLAKVKTETDGPKQ